MEVELPVAPPRSGACFMEVARRRGDFAIIGVACTVELDADGRCRQARIGLCNAGDGPVFAAQASKSLAGRKIAAPEIDAATALHPRRDRSGRQRARQQGVSAPHRRRPDRTRFGDSE